jgi:hypothetical protein
MAAYGAHAARVLARVAGGTEAGSYQAPAPVFTVRGSTGSPRRVAARADAP